MSRRSNSFKVYMGHLNLYFSVLISDFTVHIVLFGVLFQLLNFNSTDTRGHFIRKIPSSQILNFMCNFIFYIQTEITVINFWPQKALKNNSKEHSSWLWHWIKCDKESFYSCGCIHLALFRFETFIHPPFQAN